MSKKKVIPTVEVITEAKVNAQEDLVRMKWEFIDRYRKKGFKMMNIGN